MGYAQNYSLNEYLTQITLYDITKKLKTSVMGKKYKSNNSPNRKYNQ